MMCLLKNKSKDLNLHPATNNHSIHYQLHIFRINMSNLKEKYLVFNLNKIALTYPKSQLKILEIIVR